VSCLRGVLQVVRQVAYGADTLQWFGLCEAERWALWEDESGGDARRESVGRAVQALATILRVQERKGEAYRRRSRPAAKKKMNGENVWFRVLLPRWRKTAAYREQRPGVELV
jgi:hypothetical protein